MHIQTDHLPDVEAERTAGILEDRHDEHLTTQARRLADLVVASFTADNPGHWQRVASSLTDSPEILDRFAAQHGLPRPIDAVKCRAIALVESQALAASLSPIPPANERPVCVTVGWLTEHPGHAAQLEYLAGDTGWLPAADAVHCIDAEWPVEVRQALHVVGA
jgi:hypothetical protein